MTGYEDILNGVVDDNIEQYVGDGFKSQALAVEQGTSKALTNTQARNATAIAEAMQAKSDVIQKIDDTGTYVYIGKAVPASLTSGAVWQIKRIDTLGNILFAGGVATFTKIWDNRASLSYS